MEHFILVTRLLALDGGAQKAFYRRSTGSMDVDTSTGPTSIFSSVVVHTSVVGEGKIRLALVERINGIRTQIQISVFRSTVRDTALTGSVGTRIDTHTKRSTRIDARSDDFVRRSVVFECDAEFTRAPYPGKKVFPITFGVVVRKYLCTESVLHIS